MNLNPWRACLSIFIYGETSKQFRASGQTVYGETGKIKVNSLACLGIQDKETRLYITQKLVVGFHPNLHQETCRDLVHLFVYEVIIAKTQDEVP